MFQPVPMAKVVVVGPKTRLAETVEALHRLDLLHIEDYQAEGDFFQLGSPLPHGSKISERLLRVRGIIKGAQMEPPKDGRPFTVDNVKALQAKLVEVEDELGRLVEERAKIHDEAKKVDEEAAVLARISNFPLPTQYLSGYRSLATANGFVPNEADLSSLRSVSPQLEFVESNETEGRFIAVFAPKADEKKLQDALSKLDFQAVDVPAIDLPPAQASHSLAAKRAALEAQIGGLSEKITLIRERHAAAFFALDEYLSIEADKATSPVRFRTTPHSFMVEGWIPTGQYAKMEQSLTAATKNQVYVTRIERASRFASRSHGSKPHAADEHGHETSQEEHEEEETIPVKLENPKRSGPYELLTDTYSRPKYRELDPTLFMFIGFPLFYGLMLGDVGYGLLVLLMVFTGAFNALYKVFGFQSKWHLNRIFVHSGIASVVFGLVYGEFFGLELYGQHVGENGQVETGILSSWHGKVAGIPLPFSRLEYVKPLLALSLAIGILHILVGLIAGLRNGSVAHGTWAAIKHRGSWLFILLGISFAMLALVPSLLGLFEVPGAAGKALLFLAAALFLIGCVLLVAGEGAIGLMELPSIISNLLSYTRLVAIGLSGVGIALATNKIAGLTFASGSPVWMVVGIIIIIAGHTTGLLLGIIGPAIHSLRLHYVEFFTKFYEGGGVPYAPFGAQRKYTVKEVKQA